MLYVFFKWVEKSRLWTRLITSAYDVNNISLLLWIVEKCKLFALNFGIFRGSKIKCLDLPQYLQMIDVQVLTSN